MYHFQQGNPGSVPQQEQPNDQPRRPLAVNDLLNHGTPQAMEFDAVRARQMRRPQPPRLPRETRDYQYLLPPVPPPPPPPMSQPHPLYHHGTRDTTHFPFTYAGANNGRGLPPPPPPPPSTMEPRLGHDYYMSHPGEMVPVPHHQDPSRTLPEPHFQPSSGLATPSAIPSVNFTHKTCVLCLEKFEGIDPGTHFPHQCKRCASGDFCAGCLKDWFLDACKNESKMPPKCCSIIPLSAVVNLLTNVQIDLYKAKYEEWATTDRIYCPVPTCSAFIPQRLYVDVRHRPGASPNDLPPITTLIAAQPKKEMKPHVACPTCNVTVCTKCKSLSHLEECPESDLDPKLEEQLKKWKIKRCPKCRAGVRKMYGCSHVECRCGAHFCWECMLPISQCGGQCDDEASDAEPDYQVEEDDLDGNAGFYEGAGPDFGPEPYGNIVDAWGCEHRWSLVIPSSTSTLGRGNMECNRCFRLVQPAPRDPPPNTTVDEDTEMAGMNPPSPTNLFGQPVWQCFSRHIVCQKCPKQAPAWRNGDPSWLWSCNCGHQCLRCDREEAMARFANDEKLANERKEKVDSMAWECRCGTVLCGACKDMSEALERVTLRDMEEGQASSD